MSNEWEEFYLAYLDEKTDLPSRLNITRNYIKDSLCNSKNILSICGGKSLDILDLLSNDKTLYILDNDEDAMLYVKSNSGNNVKFFLNDAQMSNSYLDIPKADLLVCSGFIGAIDPEYIKKFISFIRCLIVKDGNVIWTLKNDDLQHIEYVKSIFKSFDFIELDSQITENGRFTCVKSQFIGKQLDLLPNKKIMSMSW